MSPDDSNPFGGWAEASAISHKLTGKERDSESGLDNFGKRYFGSSMGCFMSPVESALLESLRLHREQSAALYRSDGAVQVWGLLGDCGTMPSPRAEIQRFDGEGKGGTKGP